MNPIRPGTCLVASERAQTIPDDVSHGILQDVSHDVSQHAWHAASRNVARASAPATASTQPGLHPYTVNHATPRRCAITVSPTPAPDAEAGPARLRPLPPELHDRYPMILAMNEDHWMHCVDGMERRFVPDFVDGEFKPGSDGHVYSLETLQRFAHHTGGPPASDTHLAYYLYDRNTRELAYYVEGKPVASLLGREPLYPLAPGRYMVAQPHGKCHLMAAIQTMIAEGKNQQDAIAQLRACRWDTPLRHARQLHACLYTLASAERRQVGTISGADRDWFYVGIHRVEYMMKAMGGPCLFLCDGRAVIIDRVACDPIDCNDPLKQTWAIHLRQIRTGTYMVINHPKMIFTALEELAPPLDSTRSPGFRPLREISGVVSWDAFCVSVTPGLP